MSYLTANRGLIAPHLWSWGSGNARRTSQAPYSSLALVSLKDHIGNTNQRAVTLLYAGQHFFARNAKKWAGNVTFLPFHPGCQFQVPPLAPWTLELLAHPKDTHTHVLLLLGTRYWNKQSHVDTVGGQLNYLLSRGSVLPWEARQTRHSQWSGLTLRTYSWICLWTCKM